MSNMKKAVARLLFDNQEMNKQVQLFKCLGLCLLLDKPVVLAPFVRYHDQ